MAAFGHLEALFGYVTTSRRGCRQS